MEQDLDMLEGDCGEGVFIGVSLLSGAKIEFTPNDNKSAVKCTQST